MCFIDFITCFSSEPCVSQTSLWLSWSPVFFLTAVFFYRMHVGFVIFPWVVVGELYMLWESNKSYEPCTFSLEKCTHKYTCTYLFYHFCFFISVWRQLFLIAISKILGAPHCYSVGTECSFHVHIVQKCFSFWTSALLELELNNSVWTIYIGWGGKNTTLVIWSWVLKEQLNGRYANIYAVDSLGEQWDVRRWRCVHQAPRPGRELRTQVLPESGRWWAQGLWFWLASLQKEHVSQESSQGT